MKEPIFTKEAVMKLLAGQEENEKKVEALFALYNEDLNGLKMNRDDFKTEKEALEKKLAEATSQNAKIAEDFAALQKQLESSSPDERRMSRNSLNWKTHTEVSLRRRKLLSRNLLKALRSLRKLSTTSNAFRTLTRLLKATTLNPQAEISFLKLSTDRTVQNS